MELYTLVSGSTSEGSIITITNTPNEEEDYELPVTGGMGTFWYYIGGLLLLLIPFVYSIRGVSKKRRS